MAKKLIGKVEALEAETSTYLCPTCQGVLDLTSDDLTMSALFCETCGFHHPTPHFVPTVVVIPTRDAGDGVLKQPKA